MRVLSLMSQHSCCTWSNVVVTLYLPYFSNFYTLKQYYYQLLQFNNRPCFNKHLQYLFLAYIAGRLIAIQFYQPCERTAVRKQSLMSSHSWSDVAVTLYSSYYSFFTRFHLDESRISHGNFVRLCVCVSVCLSVRLSVRHIVDPHLNG